MPYRLRNLAVAALSIALWAGPAHAQIGSSCLRPLGIPDKWVEMQTPPWDPTDTFDPTGPNPDLYYDGWIGYDALEDQGRAMSLVIRDSTKPLRGQSAWPLAVGGGGSFYDEIVNCSGHLHFTGDSFPTATGSVMAPFGPAMRDLIAQDPSARWDPTANGGRGGVIDSAFAQSPRIIALPVFAPNTYVSSASSPAMTKIVGFFVDARARTIDGDIAHGYLTGWSQLTVDAVDGRIGDSVPLSATFTGPGSPVVGLPVEFLYEDRVVATAQTDGTGTARTVTMGFQIPGMPGVYPGAIRARLREAASFFVADEAAADLTVRKKLPFITWTPPAALTYGTPLGPLQLNAVADVPGEFVYAPAAGTVLPVNEHAPAPLSVTFVPADSDLYDETTGSSYVTVNPAPLTVTINNVSKFYLDPVPVLTFTATGFVNGEGPSVLAGASTIGTTATASSEVGTYRIAFEWIDAPNYAVTLTEGVLTVIPRPSATALQVPAGSSTYGQPASFVVNVSSGVGTPGGTVTLLRGDVTVGVATLIDGQATITLSSLEAGTHPLSARYSGSAGFAASSSPFSAYTVNAASTTTTLASSLNPSRAGDTTTFTAVVRAVEPGAAVPSGPVEFLRGGVVIGTMALESGTARLTVVTLPVGKHVIQARYLGTNNFRSSASATLQQTVKGGGK